MRFDSQASLLAGNLASPCLGRKPKARVAIIIITKLGLYKWQFGLKNTTSIFFSRHGKNLQGMGQLILKGFW
jgi:hypothetical protein